MSNVLAPQPGKQELAAQTNVDVMIYGGAAGSGKSRLLLNKAGYYAATDPNFEGVMFRKTTGPLKASGGLFTEAKKLYRPLDIRTKEQPMVIKFSGGDGGSIEFTHL